MEVVVRIPRMILQGFVLFAVSACSNALVDHTPLPQTPPRPPSDPLSGQLPPELQPSNGTDFYNFIRTVHWVDGKDRKRCTSQHCWWLFGKGNVHIETSQNSHELDPRIVPRGGVAVAHVVNNSGGSTIVYGLKPHYEYTFVVYPDTAHPADSASYWRLQETDPQHHTIEILGKGGPFVGCRDSAASNLDTIDFYKCFEKHSMGAVNRSSFSLVGIGGFATLIPPGDAELESPVWISCRAGCCTLDF